MCFIKTVYDRVSDRHSLLPANWDTNRKENQSSEHETRARLFAQDRNQSIQSNFQVAYQKLMFNLMAIKMNKNTQSLNFLNMRIDQCDSQIDHFMLELNHSASLKFEREIQEMNLTSTASTNEQQVIMTEELSANVLTNQLFGAKKYKYRLDLQEEFDTVIYKERNIKLNVTLKNSNGKVVKNSNIVNLCFALADDNGNWVPLNRVGDPMLKGKTEVELYHGEAQFNKIYTKDISRTFPNGRLNIVVYAKPSTLIYDGLSSEYQEHVDENSVEPLVIEDVTIKAKKKY